MVGQVAGALFAGPCSDRYGRRFGMAIGSIVCCVAVAMQTAAQNMRMLAGGRFLLGIGSSIVGVGGLSYVAESRYLRRRVLVQTLLLQYVRQSSS